MYLRAMAKINLSLDVLGKRADGYHEVRMVMQTIGMYDRLNLTPVPGLPGIHLRTNLPYIPADGSNLAVRGASILMDEFGVTDGLEIQLDKFIPVAAGLAGGSSDAAQAMIGVNRLFRLGLSREDLMKRGAAIGADVPYCILGGTALSEGIGDILTPLAPMPDVCILLCKPNINVSTRDVYTSLHLDGQTVHPDVDAQIGALSRGDILGVAAPGAMYNVLETVTAAKYPVIREIEETMKSMGACAAIMSGSGPTVFGIFEDEKKAMDCRVFLRKTRQSARTFLTWPVPSDGRKSRSAELRRYNRQFTARKTGDGTRGCAG